jgi:hypothetical protein
MAPTATAPGATGSAPSSTPVPAAQFRAGTFRTLSSDGYTQTTTLSSLTTASQLTPYTPSPNAYLRGIWIQSVCTAVNTGSPATTAFNGDMPLGVYSSVTFVDANEKPIVGPFDSYTLAMVNKFGGYARLSDPRANGQYSAVTGSGSTGGSFSHVLYVPLEIVARDTLGALQNKNSASSYQLQLTVTTSALVYSTAPAVSATLVTTCFEDGWVQPKPTDLSGTPLSQSPPQLGTTQYWTRGSYNGLNGAQQIQLTQGLGYPIRNFMGINYATGGTRATGDGYWPSPLQLIYKGTTMWNITQSMWKWDQAQKFALSSTTADTANGFENGVYVLPFNNDFDLTPGAELRNAYLPTQQGDQFQAIGSWGGGSTLYWIANYVAPAAGPNNLASIRAGR